MNIPININSKFNLFSDYWSPKVIAEMNNYQFKVVKIKGDFVWHDHKNTDETFIVIEGSMKIKLKNQTISLKAGEMIVIKKGEKHMPFSNKECKVLIIEPKGVANTGEEGGKFLAKNNMWI
jgi:mannose-6-phosphate isomerase-like protein (cupin superfamily)